MTTPFQSTLRYSSSRTDPVNTIRTDGHYRSHKSKDPTETTVPRMHRGPCPLTSRGPPEPTDSFDPKDPTNPKEPAGPTGRLGTGRHGSAQAMAGSGRHGSAQTGRAGRSEDLGENLCENPGENLGENLSENLGEKVLSYMIGYSVQ